MPGNIRVAVLEAVDLPSIVTDGKSVSVKVAVGRREFQTTPVEPQDGRTQPWNSEFLFPVLNLRDNLLVALLDNKGDVVARAELETPGIVQKGSQDAFIALKAGGRVHMKVSFVLSEDERRKIEAMRLAAMKKRKGLSQSRSRRAPVSNVKITEISSEEAERLETVDTKVNSTDNNAPLKVEDTTGQKFQKLDDVSQKHSRPKAVPTSSLIPGLSPNVRDDKSSPVYGTQAIAETAPSTNAPPRPSPNSTPECGSKPDSSKHKVFNWLSRRQHEDKTDGRWLEDLKLKSKMDKVTSLKAAKADEWIKNLDKPTEKAESQKLGVRDENIKHEGARLKNHFEEDEKRLKNSKIDKAQKTKTVKQKLEDWRLKELGPWRRSSKVRHASPPGSDHGSTRWTLTNGHKHRIDKELSLAQHPDLVAAADEMWASGLHQSAGASPSGYGSASPSSSPRNHKVPGGVKHLMKQVLNGAAAVAGAFISWPRKGSSKCKERYHTVQEGETLSSIVPDEWNDPKSNFYRLNPDILDKHYIYPGQRIRLS